MMERFYLFVNDHKRWFIWAAVIAVLSILGLPLMMNLINSRVKYDWENAAQDYGNKDCESPFGAKYYIEHLKGAWKGRVECDSDLQKSLAKHKGQKCNYIYFGALNIKYTPYDEDSTAYYSSLKDYHDYGKKLIDAVGTGNNILFCDCSIDEEDAMLVTTKTNREFYIDDFKKNAVDKVCKLSVHYIDAKSGAILDSAMIWNNMLNYYYPITSTKPEFDKEILKCYEPYGLGRTGGVLVSPNRHYYAVARHFGKGCAMLCGAKALFSNYALSAPDVQRVSDKLLHFTFDENLPLVIVYNASYEVQANDNDVQNNMLYVMFKNSATKVATYLLIIMLLLVIIFNSRRRMRAMKVQKKEQNSSLSYIRHLATLYSAKSDYKELLEIEQRKILYQLRKEYRFDMRTNSFTLPSEYAPFIAHSKGGNENDIRLALTTLESLTSGSEQVSDKSYIACLQLLASHFYDNK